MPPECSIVPDHYVLAMLIFGAAMLFLGWMIGNVTPAERDPLDGDEHE